MSLTYGYDVKDSDDIFKPPILTNDFLSPLLLPGAALVNHLPFCTIARSIPVIPPESDSYFQCGTFLHGSHTSATNQPREKSSY